MLTKLSRIFGISGNSLSLLMFLYTFICLINYPVIFFDSETHPYSFSAADLIPVLITFIGLAGSFFVRKKPVLAGVLMIVSGVLLFPCYSFIFLVPSFIPWWAALIPMPVLMAAGVLVLVAPNCAASGSRKSLNGENSASSDSPSL